MIETHLVSCVLGLNLSFCATFLCPSRHQYGLLLPFQHFLWSFLPAHFCLHTWSWFIAFATQMFLNQVCILTAWGQQGSRQIVYLQVQPHFSQNMRLKLLSLAVEISFSKGLVWVTWQPVTILPGHNFFFLSSLFICSMGTGNCQSSCVSTELIQYWVV